MKRLAHWPTRKAEHAIRSLMSKMQTLPVAGFTAGERDYIRRELDMFFASLPSVADGFQLRTRRAGPDASKPKLSPVARGLLERGLMRLVPRAGSSSSICVRRQAAFPSSST
jgi:hypothetical protein